VRIHVVFVPSGRLQFFQRIFDSIGGSDAGGHPDEKREEGGIEREMCELAS
jgi:hypothetical protein